MKILMCSDIYGGKNTFIHNEINYINKKDELLYLAIKYIPCDNIVSENFKIISYSPSSILSKWRSVLKRFSISLNFRLLSFKKEILEVISSFQPDIVHLHFGYEALRFFDNFPAKVKFKTPIFIHFHGYDASVMLRNKAYVRRLKILLKQENIYPLYVSQFIRQNLLAKGIKSANGTILYCGVDIKKFTLKKDRKVFRDHIHFLQVSSLAEKKGHEFTLRAYSIFKKRFPSLKSKLVLTGNGPRRIDLMELATILGIDHEIIFKGMIDPTEVPGLLSTADVFVHHSITSTKGDTEGLPTSIMEAMAMELPILSTYHAGIPELVKTNQNGILVKEKDIEGMANGFEEIIKMGYLAINREKIIQYYSLEKHNEALINLYRQAVKNNISID